MSLRNPAGRLRYWIDQFDHAGNRQDAIVNVAAGILGLDPNTVGGRVNVARFGADLADLCAEVRREASLLPEGLHPDMLLADFGQVEAWVDHFTLARQARVDQMFTTLDPAGRRGLEYLDRFLDTHRSYAWIEDDARQALVDQVRALIDDIVSSADLGSETKDFVLTRLEDVERALRDVLLTGAVGVEKATDALIGGLRRRPDLWDRVAKTKWGPRLAKVAGALCLALGSVGGLPALMPGDGPQPETTVYVEFPGNGAPDKGDEDVVEGEVVEADPVMPSASQE